MGDWDSRMGESEELASESLWQTAEIRNAKPNWTSFANASLLSTGCAARRVSMPCLHCCACAHCGVANSLRAGRALSAAICVGHTSSMRKIRCGRAADYSQRRSAPRMLNIRLHFHPAGRCAHLCKSGRSCDRDRGCDCTEPSRTVYGGVGPAWALSDTDSWAR